METATLIISHYGIGGSLLYLQELASALEKKGYPVIFYLPKNTELGIKNNSPHKYILKEPSTAPAFLKLKLLKYLFHLSKYFYNAYAVKPEENIKLAHLLFPFYLTDLITILRLKRKGIKVILTVHEIFPHKPFFGEKIDKKIIKKMYELSDLLLVHTDSLKKEMLELFSVSTEKVRVIAHGYFECPKSPVDTLTLKKKYHVPLDKKSLLFFGTIRENKGLDILLDAEKDLRDDFFLLIMGQIAGVSETPAKYYKEIIRKNDLVSSVYWLDKYISADEAAEIFKIADAIILPYKRSFHAQSGVLNLAIGYEKPCVVSDVGGIGETVRHYDLGVVVRPEDVQDLTSGIRTLFKGKQDFGFVRYKKENNWENVCDKLIGVYEELLSH